MRQLGDRTGRGPQPCQLAFEALSAPTDDWRDRGEEVANASGKYLRIRYHLATFWPQAQAVINRMRASPPDPSAADPELAALASHFPGRAVFLDLETCGFAGSSVFLAGMVRPLDDSLVVEQLFARDYTEERALLESLWQSLADSRVLVTFNGKSFDWPMVRDRTTRHRLDKSVPLAKRLAGSAREAPRAAAEGPAADLAHCDLLYAARRRWKPYLPNCKLQTLERYVCNRHRRGDLAGAEVPAAYHAFVRHGTARPIGAILHHNALDLATLVELAARLLGG
jgi:uncharacterized protein YprB with RNaseH-like and TPR domain